jgi:hypothetical protein
MLLFSLSCYRIMTLRYRMKPRPDAVSFSFYFYTPFDRMIVERQFFCLYTNAVGYS